MGLKEEDKGLTEWSRRLDEMKERLKTKTKTKLTMTMSIGSSKSA